MKIKGFKDTIDWYDQNAEKYDKAAANRENIDQIDAFISHLPAGAKILDAGCGSGRDTNILHLKGFDVIGLDISKGLIKLARNKFPEIEFIEGDLRRTPFGKNFFDGIWCHASLVHLETVNDVLKVLAEFNRILKHRGVIHIYVKAKRGKNRTEVVSDSLSNHERFFQYFTEDELKVLIKRSKFAIVSIDLFNEQKKYPKIKGVRKDVDWILVLARKI